MSGMVVKLDFHSACGQFVAFSVDGELYFAQVEPVFAIYDCNLNKQQIPNFDFWIQAKTHQRYSFQSFLDAISAFRSGLAASYSLIDLETLVAKTVMATRNHVLALMGRYQKVFWIEVLDPTKIESLWVPEIRAKFEYLRSKLGDNGLFDYLCRFWSFCRDHQPGSVAVFERLIARLGKQPQAPVYCPVDAVDNELAVGVIKSLNLPDFPLYKTVSADVNNKLRILNAEAS